VPKDSTAEKTKLISHLFNSIASKYDLMNTLLSFGLHYFWKNFAVKSLRVQARERVIDICGGTADLTLLAAKAIGPNGRAILYDFSWAMIEVGKIKAARNSHRLKINFVQGNAEEISFSSGYFDKAMVGFGLRNLAQMEKGLKEIYRILKPGGKLMVLEFSQPTAIWFKWLYDLYSSHFIPFLGKIIAGSRPAYVYLPNSIRLFPPPDQLSAVLKRIGFSEVTYRRLTNGIATVHIGVKP